MAWREDNRRVSNGVQYLMITDAALKHRFGSMVRLLATELKKMENEHALNALLRKRAELAGQFEHHQAVLPLQLLIDIDSLDATIRLFAPDIDLADVKPKPLPPRHGSLQGRGLTHRARRRFRDRKTARAPLRN